ncbi:HAMP domain-containing protein [bacterium]|nr:MAG: HAMP domain-containing protein [bacterium]
MRKKIIASLLAIFLFFSVGVVLSVYYITSTTEELNHIISLHQVEQLRRTLIISIQNVQTNLYAYDTPFGQDLDFIAANVEKLENISGECTSCHHSPRVNTRIIKTQSLIGDYIDHLSFYITMRANSERIKKIKSEAVMLGNKIISQTENMSHSASTSLERLTKDSTEKIYGVRKILIVTIFISTLIGIVIAWYLTISVTHPVRALVNATRTIASGDYGTKISYSDETEFGELSKHFNDMSAKLEARSKELEAQSEELKKKVSELEQFYEMSVGRELRMKELKKEVERLKAKLPKNQK